MNNIVSLHWIHIGRRIYVVIFVVIIVLIVVIIIIIKIVYL